MTSIDTTAIQRLDAIFSSSNDYEEGTRRMHAEFVVIPRADLPLILTEEPQNGYTTWTFTDDTTQFLTRENLNDARSHAYRLLTIAEHFDKQDAEGDAKQSEAEAKRDARRDELAKELTARSFIDGMTYDRLLVATQRAIDMIIDLEAKA